MNMKQFENLRVVSSDFHRIKMKAILFLFILVSFGATAQLNTADGLVLKPRIGFGVGTLLFKGDIGGDSKGYNLLTADAGFSATASQEVTSFLELEFQSVYGRFRVNEINTQRRYNFQSSIHSLGINAVYNFSHFFPKNRVIEPWFAMGISSFEFLTKTDLRDKNGIPYHYWSDGSIRDMAESDPFSENAALIERDYVYETDARELNADGLGKYPDRSWSVPVGAGANMRLSERFRVRFGTTMNYTFTDLVDNVSSEGTGIRQGNSKNDRFLYTSVGINYDLHFTPKNQPVPIELMDEKGEMYIAYLSEDSDGDGVNDFIDLSAGTPPGTKVDKFGVPIDSDGDGFADYVDVEAFSIDLSTIDLMGETKGDEWVQFRYGAWIDSVRWSAYAGDGYMKRDFKRINGAPGFDVKKRYYDVVLAIDKNEKTQEEIDALLSVKDLRTEKIGSETRYSAGQFDEVTEAVVRKIELEVAGIDGRVELTTPQKRIDMTPLADAIAREIRAESVAENNGVINSLDSQKPIQNEPNKTDIPVIDSSVISETNPKTSTTGNQKGQEKSNQVSGTELISGNDNPKTDVTGNSDALPVAAPNASAITGNQTGHEYSTGVSGTELISGSNKPKTNVTETLYRVQLGAFKKPLSEDMFNGINGVISIKGTDGLTRYTVGSFNNLKDAADLKIKMHLAGFEDAFITSYQGVKRVLPEESLPLPATPTEASTDSISAIKADEPIEAKEEKNAPPKPEPIKDIETSFINSEKIRFTVVLGTYSSQIPTEAMDTYLSLGGVKPVRNTEKGITSYTKGDFSSPEEAEILLKELRENGLPGAVIGGRFNNQVIPTEEAVKLKFPDRD